MENETRSAFSPTERQATMILYRDVHSTYIQPIMLCHVVYDPMHFSYAMS